MQDSPKHDSGNIQTREHNNYLIPTMEMYEPVGHGPVELGSSNVAFMVAEKCPYIGGKYGGAQGSP